MDTYKENQRVASFCESSDDFFWTFLEKNFFYTCDMICPPVY